MGAAVQHKQQEIFIFFIFHNLNAICKYYVDIECLNVRIKCNDNMSTMEELKIRFVQFYLYFQYLSMPPLSQKHKIY